MPPTKQRELDLSEFPSGTVTEYTTLVCLACIFDIFTKQLGCARRQAKLFGEDVEDAGETNERRIFSYRAGRKLAQIELALFRWRHAWDLTTKTRSHKEAQKGQK